MRMWTWLGLFIGIGGILLGNVLEGGSVFSLLQFAAALIVFGGTFGATMVSNRRADMRLAFKFLRHAFAAEPSTDRQRLATQIINSAQLVRRESILVLEGELNRFADPFMKSIYRFIIDGVDPEVLRKIFTEEINISERRKMAAVKVWSDAGGFAPTIGIIGAVLGLISVMANITDTSMLGKGIAVAFVATIYGVGSANLIFIPLANRMRSLIRYRSETEHMILEGALATVLGLNPYLIEQKMRAFTEPVATP